MRQAEGQDLPPVAITQDDRQDVLVTMKLEDWMGLFPAVEDECGPSSVETFPSCQWYQFRTVVR